MSYSLIIQSLKDIWSYQLKVSWNETEDTNLLKLDLYNSKYNKCKSSLYTAVFVTNYQRHVSAIKAMFKFNKKSYRKYAPITMPLMLWTKSLFTSNRCTTSCIFFYHSATAPSGARPPHYRGFMVTLRHTTLGRTTLDEWSAPRRDLYLTHNTRKSHPCPRWDSNQQSQQARGHRPTP